MARRKAKPTLGGFSVEPTPISASWLVSLMPGAELTPQPYSQGYVIIPWRAANLIRVTRKGQRIVSQAVVAHKVNEPFWVEPPPAGLTYSLRNVGSGVSIFQKVVPPGQPPVTGPQPTLPIEKLVVRVGQTPEPFQIEMATTIREWEVGLAFRSKIAPRGGMLFDWHSIQQIKMQTRQMEVPVDIVFLDERGRIVFIAANEQPGSAFPIDCGRPSRAVLELAGGTMASIGAKVGGRVEQRIFAGRGRRGHH
jgi:uncharacterized membrane protein (UPF0127 family)